MRRISSKWTFFYKRAFPVIWFGFLALFIAIPLRGGVNKIGDVRLPFFVVPALMAVLGYFLMSKLVFDLVDEVWDDVDALIVKNRSQEERIALSDIKNVSYSPYINPPRVTLSLRRPTVFGEEITFVAPARFVPFSKSPAIVELIYRVDAARKR